MGALGRARVFLWLSTIVIILAGSLGAIIYNKPLGLKGLGAAETLPGQVWYNAVIAFHAVTLIGAGFEIISRAYLMMVGSTCSEQKRVFLCCFLYSMTKWWKLMMIIEVITTIVLGGLTGLVMVLGKGTAKNPIDLVRMAATDGISVVQVLFTALSFVQARKIQKLQDEEEERQMAKKPIHAHVGSSSSASEPPCTILQKEKEQSKSVESSPSSAAIMPA
ncbi:hypothetical protein DFA_10855 [Cavenderia fasciculata]|uniref:Transmembrane protein n=1 Tax=Cavenderia fasciculata TaxID=261658 RepID=F4QBK9_CACFS|nr:uncharacterized protein DFA_10855 [Cavenderia fasciculata]EGG14597.1 hypothetical protein DFA_10855 [Cavenderia fasciculata]|eukprot:XP_004351105.1 hypothetical protein DFA_10855 [Cavenderia fasciculata]